MISHFKKSRFTVLSSVLLSLYGSQVYADTWQLDDLISRTAQYQSPYFFYVGKGETWQNIQFNSQFDSQGESTLVVRYDNQMIHRQNLNGKGELSFTLPASTAGFHRLDVMLLQKPSVNGPISNNYCVESTNLYTALTKLTLNYQAQHGILQLNQLPDALFNTQLSRTAPIKALLQFNSQNRLEASMIARLATAWKFNTPVQWQVAESTPQEAPDFVISIQQVEQPLAGARISLSRNNEIPRLNIEYSSESQLLMAVNALINQNYLQQLNTATATLSEPVAEPAWAVIRKFETLADLGISDFALDSSSKNISLVFPPVWEATDVLKGKLAFRAQSGLLQGSTLQVWLNEYLAGSLSLAKLDSNPVERLFDFVGADYPYVNNYNMTLINSQLNNEACLPNAGTALWIDANKSLVNLPHQMKQGVINLSTIFASTPEIAINNPAATSMAITVANVTKTMLLSDQPVPVNITELNANRPKKINILVNTARFNDELQRYSQLLYLPATAGGFIVSVKDGRFWINTDSAAGAQTFTRFWPVIQQSIPNNTAVLFVSAQGQITVLSKNSVNKAKAPVVEQVSTRTLVIVLTIITLIIIALILWRRSRRKVKGTGE
ncbi:hypothetical protein [Acinetobacter sp. UBA1297]|uniref:hypothetical protein n=1 Tax=Acinetobacter sp. UBA1297 TaxID=1945925 RepID=UPI00257F2D5F|nr:hypothetical protein [Acinetobacter sp. UBA1297]